MVALFLNQTHDISTSFGLRDRCIQMKIAIRNMAADGNTIRLLLVYQPNQLPSAAVFIM